MLVEFVLAAGGEPGPAKGCQPICPTRSGRRPVPYASVVWLFRAQRGSWFFATEAINSAKRNSFVSVCSME